MSWNPKLQEWISTLVRWVTRRRHASRAFLKYGGLIAVATCGGGLTYGVRSSAGSLHFDGFITTGESLPLWALLLGLFAGLLLVAIGASMSLSDWLATRKATLRKALIVIELRGLVDTSDRPLLTSLPRQMVGQRLDGLVDVRKLIEVEAIDAAFRQILGIPDTIRRLRGSREAAQVDVVVGGVLQVPLLFLAGVLLDDEGRVTAFDWHRSTCTWKDLNEPDDGERFRVEGLESLPAHASHVVLAVSASYAADRAAIRATFGDAPVVSLSLSNPLPDSLWSGAKQEALAAQFVSTLAGLGNRDVQRVSLVLAAPSSLVVRMGRAYDRRNMPEIACLQYERAATPPYPWAVLVAPTGASVISTRSPETDVAAR